MSLVDEGGSDSISLKGKVFTKRERSYLNIAFGNEDSPGPEPEIHRTQRMCGLPWTGLEGVKASGKSTSVGRALRAEAGELGRGVPESSVKSQRREERN